MEQAESNAQALDLHLTERELADLEEVSRGFRENPI